MAISRCPFPRNGERIAVGTSKGVPALPGRMVGIPSPA